MAESPPQYSSLISIELQKSLIKQPYRVHLDEVQDSGPDAAQSVELSKISILEVITSENILELDSKPLPEPRIVKYVRSGLTARQKWGYADPEVVPPKPVLSKLSEHTTVHKGFGRFMLENETVAFKKRIFLYPPLPNSAYNFLNKIIEPRNRTVKGSSFNGAALVKEYLLKKTAERVTLASEKNDNLGEQIAKKIDWTHRLYNGGDMSSQSVPGFCITYWRDDLVRAIDDAKALGEEPFELCSKCQKRHIAWGPSIAMHDRDTCLSRLPDWFPTEEFEEPWNAFTQIINKVVRFEEIEQGRLQDPNRNVWDKSYHESSDDWTISGRKAGGWWKCRTGDSDNKTHVPTEERNCRLCHREKNDEVRALEAKVLRDANEKARIHIWIQRCMKIQMMKDKAVVEAGMRYDFK